jgi:glutamine synthetase
VRIIPESCRDMPTEGGPNESGTTGGMLLFLAEFAGAAEAICPRGVLRRVIDKAKAMGFAAKSALEYEFFVFEETPHSVRDKFYRGLKPISPGYFGYSVLRNSVMSDWYHALLQLCEGMDMGLEGLHTETGAGVLEAAIRVDDTLASADKGGAVQDLHQGAGAEARLDGDLHGQVVEGLAGLRRPHASVAVESGTAGDKSAFFDVAAPHRMSAAMRAFVAGQQALMPELLALVAPTVNSYRRLIPGFWAPTSATWGVENRTTALRVIPGSAKSQRVEYRIAAADGNPYLTLAAALASGLWGIENKLELGAPIDGNAYAKEHAAALDLPRTLGEAAQRLRASKPARALFGDAFVDHYAATRTWEEREFRKHISDWELDRYFEII